MTNEVVPDFLTAFSSGKADPINFPVKLRPANENTNDRWLFVDDSGLVRSATAAALAIKSNINARAAGSLPQQSLIPVTLQLVGWAQKVIFLDQESYDNTMLLFTPYPEEKAVLEAKSQILNIPNTYFYMQSDLTDAIAAQIPDISLVR